MSMNKVINKFNKVKKILVINEKLEQEVFTEKSFNDMKFRSEECECAHMYLDKLGVPTSKNDKVLSLVGRINYLENNIKNKYYTPEIEEFHVGFEYQINQQEELYGEITYGNEWIEDEYDGSFSLLNSDLSRYRVKYLDDKDIESLGFKEDTYNGVKCFTKNNCQIFFFPHNIIPDCNIVSIDLFVGEFRNQYFRGLVKNKSELKTILKQIANGI